VPVTWIEPATSRIAGLPKPAGRPLPCSGQWTMLCPIPELIRRACLILLAFSAVDRGTFATEAEHRRCTIGLRQSSAAPPMPVASTRALPDDRRGRPSPYLGKPRMIWTTCARSDGRQDPRVDGI